jgi:uncharacterized protein (TIGR04255 family)
MSTSTLGTWSNPPLAYVVAELVISPYYSLGAKLPALQDALREAYPRTIEAQELVIDESAASPVPPQPQPLWRLISADQGQGVQFGTRAISLHATQYVDSKDFFRRWAMVLGAVADAKLGAFVERAGLRVVDLIVPSTAHTTRDYLVDGLRGITLNEGIQARSAMWVGMFNPSDEVVVNVRIGAPAPEGMLLPPTLNALPLQKPKVMQDAEAALRTGKSVGFIDTDCLRNVQRVFDAPYLVEAFGAVQKVASNTFKALISDMARKEWE